MNLTRARLAAGLFIALIATVASPASLALGASATISGNDDNPIPLTAGTTVRHMSPDVKFVFDVDEKRYSSSITGPGGQSAADGTPCTDVDAGAPNRVKYSGDGTYTVTLQVSKNPEDTTCAEATTQTFTFAIDTTVAITSPTSGTTLPLRKFGDTGFIVHNAEVTVIAGADREIIRYARNATVGADGGITGDFEEADVYLTGKNADLALDKPGTWTLQVRNKIFVDGQERFGPWSPTLVVKVVAPFDLRQDLAFPDARGPKYKIAGVVGEPSTKGSIKVFIAKGRKGGRFKKLGVTKIRSGGRFSLKFKLRTFGVFRLKFVYAGSATTAGGTIIYPVKVRKVLF